MFVCQYMDIHAEHSIESERELNMIGPTQEGKLCQHALALLA
jgi:hypothetical protein